MPATTPNWVVFEQKCFQFYQQRLKLTVRGVGDKAVRAILEIPGWQINLARRPEHHAIADQQEWRKSGARVAGKAADFLVEVSSNHWIIAEAKSSESPDPRFLDQLANTLLCAQRKKPNIILELHLLIPSTVDTHRLFVRDGICYSVESPLRDLSGFNTGKLVSSAGTYRISGIPVLVILVPES